MDIYEQKQILPHFWMIGERLCSWQLLAMGILIGRERAALIDTGMGVLGDLAQKVRTFTDLPLITLLTHGDPDHIGAAELFSPLYMSKLDDELIPWALSPACRWENMVNMAEGNDALLAEAKTKMLRGTQISYRNIEEGDLFDLGGVKLEANGLARTHQGQACALSTGRIILLS